MLRGRVRWCLSSVCRGLWDGSKGILARDVCVDWVWWDLNFSGLSIEGFEEINVVSEDSFFRIFEVWVFLWVFSKVWKIGGIMEEVKSWLNLGLGFFRGWGGREVEYCRISDDSWSRGGFIFRFVGFFWWLVLWVLFWELFG